VAEGVTLARQLARTVGPQGEEGETVPELVCVDGVDYLAARSAVEAGLVRLAPGGLSWIDDRLTSG